LWFSTHSWYIRWYVGGTVLVFMRFLAHKAVDRLSIERIIHWYSSNK
jgi:hypothetical protein